MTNYLYRFRGDVLGKHQELENQEIFCPSLQTLNDPMEGFKDLFWSGDKIVWTSLLKHYLLCLDRVCVRFMLNGAAQRIDPASIPVFEIESDLPTREYKDVFKQACDTFFGTPAVLEFIDALASRSQPVRRDELCVHLRMAHFTALGAIFAAYRDRAGIPDTPGGSAFFDTCATLPVRPETPRAVNELEAQRPAAPHSTELLFAVMRNAQQQGDLIAKSNAPDSILNCNRLLLLSEFPGEYVSLLETVVYGPWYTACFTGNHTNSSMWGNYANGHRGVCLKFHTGGVADENVLSLHGVTGFHISTPGRPEPNHGQVKYRLHKVTYQSAYPEVDFFRSLGRLRGEAVSWWYSDGHGNRSSCLQDVYGDEQQWREGYWARFRDGQTTKLKDWEYEDEYRLVRSELSTRLSDPTLRKLRYNLSDLHGIIFGIATSEADKLAIVDIIRRKCRVEKHGQFKFYQAYYAKHKGSIEALPLSLIKV
jgi:hypothetical protein